MEDLSGLPDGWVTWSTGEDGGVVLAFRPDVFDGSSFPPACLPTLSVARPGAARAPGVHPNASGWTVTLSLEPAVPVDVERVTSREAALERARALARQFSDGEIAIRESYEDPREGYLDRLEELRGREP